MLTWIPAVEHSDDDNNNTKGNYSLLIERSSLVFMFIHDFFNTYARSFSFYILFEMHTLWIDGSSTKVCVYVCIDDTTNYQFIYIYIYTQYVEKGIDNESKKK